jgi:hypothetical protein
MGVWYCTRDDVKRAVDVKDSARANAQIDRIIEDVSRTIEEPLCHRVFYPRVATRRFDWPNDNSPTPWRIWLSGRSELLSITAITSGGLTVSPATVLLYPDDGPPYTSIEIDRSSSSSFDSGSTPQNSIVITGLYGYSNDEITVGALAEALDATETAVDVTDAHLIGVGAVLRCDTERMIVTEKLALDTGVDVATTALTAQMNNTTITLSTAVGAPTAGEMIIIDGERMMVNELISTTAYVTRAYDGTVLATHAIGANIYAYRTLIVERGALGTTAVTHTTATTLYRWKPPGPVEGLAVAETLGQLAQENSAYARVIGAGENQREARGAGLRDKRNQVRDGYARKARTGAV